MKRSKVVVYAASTAAVLVLHCAAGEDSRGGDAEGDGAGNANVGGDDAGSSGATAEGGSAGANATGGTTSGTSGTSGSGTSGGGTSGGGTSGTGGEPSTCEGELALRLTLVTTADAPLAMAQATGDDRLYVLERAGRIRILEGGALTTFFSMATPPPTNSERGLLGFALHPDFVENGRFFIYYTRAANDMYSSGGTGDVVIAEGSRSTGSEDTADAETTPLLVLSHSQTNHNGGGLAFGPGGYLYASVGEGCSDRRCAALLRMDVDDPDLRVPGNFPEPAGPQLWIRGLRNPWRFSFDRGGSNVFIGDVGSDLWEEINVVSDQATGMDLGWPTAEGSECREDGCDLGGLTPPTLAYSSDTGGASRSVTGGYVYRGSGIPCLVGRYVYGDYATNQVFSFIFANGEAIDPMEHTTDLSTPETRIQGLTSFGEDTAGELYILDLMGHVYRIDRE